MKKRYVHVIIGLLFLFVTIFIINAVVNKTKAWHFSESILVTVDGYTMTLQEAIDNNLLNGGATQSFTEQIQDPGHSADVIWVSVDGVETTLQNAISTTDLCGSSSTTSYESADIPNPSHLASEIEISPEKSLQDAVDDGDFCCVPDTCADLGYNCGIWDDGCDGILDCGACDSGWSMDTSLSSADASFLGEAAGDGSGYHAVSKAGDVNGDGYDDFLIGAYRNGEGGSDSGQTYLIFGKSSGWSMDTSLSGADASFIGEAADDSSGISISGAGDVNGDGYDDFLIGAYRNDEGGDMAGQTYLIFGKASGWSMDISLSSADASFIGENSVDLSGWGGVSGAGDVNGDGYDDFLIGSLGNDEGGLTSGQTYLIFGKASGWTMDIDLSSADASFIGEAIEDRCGQSASGAGDINNDGYDDFLIGNYPNDEGGDMAGQTYLIFGKASGWSMDIDLSNVDASFIGEVAGDWSGFSVSGAGDVNDDGYDDFLIGAYGNDEGGGGTGQTYLILGKLSGWTMDIDLSSADASFIGEAADASGYHVSGAGDVNGDGYDDFLISAHGNDEGGSDSGQTYLILGP